jgi:hypothetical protein
MEGVETGEVGAAAGAAGAAAAGAAAAGAAAAGAAGAVVVVVVVVCACAKETHRDSAQTDRGYSFLFIRVWLGSVRLATLGDL